MNEQQENKLFIRLLRALFVVRKMRKKVFVSKMNTPESVFELLGFNVKRNTVKLKNMKNRKISYSGTDKLFAINLDDGDVIFLQQDIDANGRRQ